MRLTYVYLIGPEGGPYKVGIADDLKKRLTTLQVGCWEDLIVHHTVSVPSTLARHIEKVMHYIYKPMHMRGEWYDVDLAELRSEIDKQAADRMKVRADNDTFSPSECFHLCRDPALAFTTLTRYRNDANRDGAKDINSRLLAKVGLAAHLVFTQTFLERRDLTKKLKGNARLARQAEASLITALNGLVEVYQEASARRLAA